MVEEKDKHRILLIRPYFEMLNHELGFLPFEPLGLQYIKSALLAKDQEVEIFDCPVEHPRNIRYLKEKNLFRCGSEDKDIIKKIRQFKPDIVGISGMFYAQSDPFYHIADLVKIISKKIIVFGGGSFPSSYNADVLKDNRNLDIVIVGEGEETITDLIANLDNLEQVRGICFRKSGSSEIICTEPRPINMNIDKILFPHRDFSKIYNYSKPVGYNYSEKFNLLKFIKSSILYSALSLPVARYCFAKLFNWRHRNKPKSLLMPHGFIITSRGCPNRCTFCVIHKVWGGIYRMRSAKNVLDEIDLLVKHGVKEIVIVDDNFTVSRTRTITICREIIDRGYNIRILTPSGVFIGSLDSEVLKYLYDAGLKELIFGVENGYQEFLDRVIQKNLKLNQVKEIVALAKEIGFITRGFFMFGYPGETRETMLKTLRFAFESGMNAARFYVFQPLPGTKAYQMALDMGALDKNLDFSKLRMKPETPVLETKDFTKNDVMKIFNLAYDILNKGNYEEIKDKIPNLLGWQ